MKIKEALTRKKKSVGVNVQINEIKKKKEKLVAKNYQKNSYPYLTDFASPSDKLESAQII